MVGWCWVNSQCRGVLVIWSMVGQWPTALAGLFRHIFLSSIFLSSFSLSLGDGPIWAETLFQRAAKPLTTNEPTVQFLKNRLPTKK